MLDTLLTSLTALVCGGATFLAGLAAGATAMNVSIRRSGHRLLRQDGRWVMTRLPETNRKAQGPVARRGISLN